MKAAQTMSKQSTASLAQAMGNTNTAEVVGSSEPNTNDESLAENLFPGAALPSTDQLRQQEQLEKDQEKEKLKQELHAQVNPEDQTEVFAQRNEADEQEIEGLIASLFQMVQEKQIPEDQVPEILETRVVSPGAGGSLFKGLLTKAQEFITNYQPQDWAAAMNSKSRKMSGPGARTKQVKNDAENPEHNVHQGA